MTEQQYEQFFDLLDEIISSNGSWQSKRDALDAQASSERDKANLGEIAAWFIEEE